MCGPGVVIIGVSETPVDNIIFRLGAYILMSSPGSKMPSIPKVMTGHPDVSKKEYRVSNLHA